MVLEYGKGELLDNSHSQTAVSVLYECGSVGHVVQPMINELWTTVYFWDHRTYRKHYIVLLF